MDYVSLSQTIFYIVIAICALWLTIFVSIALYYVVNSIRQVNLVVRQAKAKLDAVEDVFHSIKEKITSSSTYLNLLMSGIGKVTDLMGSNNEGDEDEDDEPKKKSKRSKK
jgi:hypothetical protein